MNTRNLTANQIHELGIEALMSKLGAAGMIRFLNQYETGKGNYSVDRDQWLTVPDVETLANQIQGARENAAEERQDLNKATKIIPRDILQLTAEMDQILQRLDETMKINPRDEFQKTEEVHRELQRLGEVMKSILRCLRPMT